MKNYKKILILIPLFVFLFYSGIFFTGKPNKKSINFNYFKYLSYSVLHGRFDIDCPPETNCHDLVEYKGKHYLYWPWVPALIYIPFVAISGTNTYDILISGIFGALNVFLIIILIKYLSSKFNLGIKESEIILLSLFWGIGTVHFYMSMVGEVWFISQIMAQTFLLLSMIFILKSVDIKNFFISGLFFSMAVYTKNDLLFSIFFIMTIWFITNKKEKKISKIVVFFIPFIIFTILNFAYNYIRFENIFENGIKYHKMHKYFLQNYANHGYFSVFYIPYNFFVEVLLPPPLKAEYPFFDYIQEGFGFLWNSPLFLLTVPVFFILLKKIFYRSSLDSYLKTNDLILLSGTFLSMFFISLVIFSIMGTGWVQFASRYSLDYQIFVFIFLLYAFKLYRKKKWFYPVTFILFLISFYMNYNGVLYFFSWK